MVGSAARLDSAVAAGCRAEGEGGLARLVAVAGRAVQWLRDSLGLITSASEIEVIVRIRQI